MGENPNRFATKAEDSRGEKYSSFCQQSAEGPTRHSAAAKRGTERGGRLNRAILRGEAAGIEIPRLPIRKGENH